MTAQMDDRVTLALVVGSTETARIDGISAAGADPEAMRYTPIADAEIVAAGHPIEAPAVPVSPSGCPTPAVITRAVRDLLGFDVDVFTAGVRMEPSVPTSTIATDPGGDVRSATPVPDAESIVERGRQMGRSVDSGKTLVFAESIPGGTTTALGVLEALGEEIGVSSSLRDNPLGRKRAVVGRGLTASGMAPGDAAGRPTLAVRRMGDPVLGSLAGLVQGALGAEATVILGGGTQMLAVTALLRHAGIDDRLTVATTRFVAEDPSVDLQAAGQRLDVDIVVTDPGFDRSDHVMARRFQAGEAKEGVGLGGALAVAERAGRLHDVLPRSIDTYEELIADYGP